MLRKLAILLLVVPVVGSTPLMAQTGINKGQDLQNTDTCNDLWKQATANLGDHIVIAESESYISNFGAVDTDLDDKISYEEFLSACHKGLISTVVSD